MSKQWSSTLAGKSIRYWSERLYRNSYTRAGRLLRVRGWSVKIQHEGRRRTFSLGAVPRSLAARRARALHRTIVTRGWEAVLAHPFALPRTSGGRGAPPVNAAQARYWQRRLLTRRYTEGLRPQLAGELSVRIEHAGQSRYFPLGTADRAAAARRAAEIYRTLVAEGWHHVARRIAREITVAVFWSHEPLACTYTTLFTCPEGDPAGQDRRGVRISPGMICVVEADDGVRHAVASCVAMQMPGWRIATLSSAADALHAASAPGLGLVLINRNLPDMSGGECAEHLKTRSPNLPIYTYGIYDDSDQLFLSFSGVGAGYILRRRPPALLLEPIGLLPARRAPSARLIADHVRRYFQGLFGEPSTQAARAMARLTPREQDILELLSKGYIDKEIAQRLGISAWTVHGHLRSIFDKFQVHTRTEAVVKYLQK
jgi:DNA-binding NarL/FixJ family response regulator